MMRVVMTLMVFMATLSTVWAQTKTLYFLNKPESITAKQSLAKINVQAGERVRVFLHYINSGKNTMKFELKSSPPALGAVGFSFSGSPGIAGSEAALEFFQSNMSNINIAHHWHPGQTISGIIEFTAKKDTQINCGTGDIINPKTSIAVMDMTDTQFVASVDDKPAKIRFGGDGTNSNKGQYGIKKQINITNVAKDTKDILVYASPRAGNAVVTWGVNGIYHNTPMMRAKARVRIATFTLRANQSMRLTTMPVGGIAYPVEFEFVPRTTETSENASELHQQQVLYTLLYSQGHNQVRKITNNQPLHDHTLHRIFSDRQDRPLQTQPYGNALGNQIERRSLELHELLGLTAVQK